MNPYNWFPSIGIEENWYLHLRTKKCLQKGKSDNHKTKKEGYKRLKFTGHLCALLVVPKSKKSLLRELDQ